jgi:hypothetical protein
MNIMRCRELEKLSRELMSAYRTLSEDQAELQLLHDKIAQHRVTCRFCNEYRVISDVEIMNQVKDWP